MQKRIERNEFLEYATVHGNIYGTSYQSIQDVIASNRSCILDIDIQGVQSVMKKQAEGTYILIIPPSIEELRRRLYARNMDSEESIQLRLHNCEQELRIASSLPFSHTIVNDSVDEAYDRLKKCLSLYLA